MQRLLRIPLTASFCALAGATPGFLQASKWRTEDRKDGQHIISPASPMSMAQVRCPAPPTLDGKNVQDIIENTKGILMIANPQMRCTLAAKAAMQAKGVQYQEHTFETPFAYAPGASVVWDWLHCTYPNDDQDGAIMHSYVFKDGSFLGQGFQAAETIKSDAAKGTGASCEQRYPEDAQTLKHFQDNATSKVLLFGWLSCPCTGIAQSRFATQSICYEGRTWANPESTLMAYLQCKEAAADDHSFVYFRDASGAWQFKGNGFQFDEDAMADNDFNALVHDSGVEKTCHHATVNVNVYGTPLEECRVGSDMSGSWQDDGTCSEQIGGIHEICIENLPADFSTATHQPPWSEDRAGKRHCVCIGAWSLYMTDAEKHVENAEEIMPHCKAIPETALTDRYLENWKDWNGYPANIVKGTGELVSRCLDLVDSSEPHSLQLKCGLKQRFEALASKVTDLQTSPDLAELKSDLAGLQCPSAA
mmetsp:Transcript_31709/g.67440  ORF Transcript_31709/g.67440 Transcript_31709/m.67440 type:complete len:476 (+) Transcript_31709:120-1547(+)